MPMFAHFRYNRDIRYDAASLAASHCCAGYILYDMSRLCVMDLVANRWHICFLKTFFSIFQIQSRDSL